VGGLSDCNGPSLRVPWLEEKRARPILREHARPTARLSEREEEGCATLLGEERYEIGGARQTETDGERGYEGKRGARKKEKARQAG